MTDSSSKTGINIKPAKENPPPANITLRYCLFLLLVFNSGIVESFSYLYLDNVFCGFATGTLIILGLKIVSAHAGDAIAPSIVALGGFCLGSFMAGQIQEQLSPPPPAANKLNSAPSSNTNPSPSPSNDTIIFRKVKWLLLAELPFLVAATIVAGQAGLDQLSSSLVTTALTAIAMGCQMTAGVTLQVPLLAMPLATGTINTLFSDNPLKRSIRDKTLRKASMLFSLILGSTAGTGLSLIRPWVALLFACAFVVVMQVVLFVCECGRSKNAAKQREAQTTIV